MAEELQDIIERVVAGSRDEADIRAIVSALQSKQSTLVPGARAVGISGDVNHAIIVTGNHNIVIPEQIAELLQALLAQLSSIQPTESASVEALVQQVRSHCCSKILNLYSKIQLLNRKQVDVDQFYVDVYLLEKLSNDTFATIPSLLEGRDLRESDRIGLGNRGSRLPGLAVVSQHSRLIIFGKPGSGKSTFLKRLAVACAKETEILAEYIPVLLELRFVREAKQFDLWEILKREFRVKERSQVEQILNQAPIFLLLDGLDEVPTAFRQIVQNQISDFAHQYYNSRCILTCRTQTTEYILPNFESAEVADFNPGQVEIFARNWFSSIASSPEEAIGLKDHFMLKLRENQPTADLAVTPILLSLTCWVFGDLKALPPKRSDLYEQGINLLLSKWDERRGIQRQGNSAIYQKYSLKERQELLSFIATRKFEQEQYILFEQTELVDYITEYLKISSEDAEAVLEDIAGQHGLLIERSQKIWSFSHLTFQEFLSAKAFVESSDWKKLARYISEKHWRTVFLLTIEMAEAESAILLQEMKQTIENLVTEDKKIQKLLAWITEKALSVEAPTWYDRAAIRAIYFDIARGKAYAAYSTHESGMLSQVFSLAWAIDSELGIDLELAIEIGRSRHRDRLYNLVQDIELSAYENQCQWQFDTQQEELLQKYYISNDVLVDCLNSAYGIENFIEEQVKNMLLLPIAEIEKRDRNSD